MPTVFDSSDSSAWDSVHESMSAYFDMPSSVRVPAWDALFPAEGFETGLRNLGRRHTMPSYLVPGKEVSKAGARAAVVEDDAAPSFLEAYLELVFPGEGLNVLQGRSAHQVGSPRCSGKSRQSDWSGAVSQKKPLVPVAHELRAGLRKVYSSEVMPALKVPADFDSQMTLGSQDSDSVSTISGAEAVEALPSSNSSNSLGFWSSEYGTASSDMMLNEAEAAVPSAHVGPRCWYCVFLPSHVCVSEISL